MVLKRTGGKIDWQEGRDLWWHDPVEQTTISTRVEEMNAKILFILYTSGSTGKPKGVHTTGGYLVYAALTFKYVFDYHRATSTGAPPMWAGLPDTVICCMARHSRRDHADV